MYLNGVSAGEAYLSKVGSQVYAVGTNGYDITEDVKSRLAARGDQMITNQDIPVPTWFVNYDAADHSLQYWKTANDCSLPAPRTPTTAPYMSKAGDSDAWQTQYAGPISKVAVDSRQSLSGREDHDFLTCYTRYDNTSAYGNALMLRGDYTDVIVNAHKSPDRYAEQKVTMPDGATATMICTIVDIEGEPREILFYIPENASELQPDGAPVITVWAGRSQTNIIFFDSTCWWETANQNGIALIFTNEAYNTSVAVTPPMWMPATTPCWISWRVGMTPANSSLISAGSTAPASPWALWNLSSLPRRPRITTPL